MRSPGLRIADYALDARTHVIEVDGEIDLHGASSLKEEALEVHERVGSRVVFDLSRVRFIDSAGLAALLDILKWMEPPEGSLALVVTDYDIERLLTVTGLVDRFSLHRSQRDAVDSLSSSEASATED